MDDPRLQPAPTEQSDRIVALARDLAYGAFIGDWSHKLCVANLGENAEDWVSEQENADVERLRQYFDVKWTSQRLQPRASSLQFLGYIERDPDYPVVADNVFQLTQKAVGLLEHPAKPPTVFIAYQHRESTPFALLIEARLKAEGIIPFLDKNIDGGEEWEQRIKTFVETEAEFLICLIAPRTLESINVRNEILWATQAERDVWCIPIWHHGFKIDEAQLQTYPKEVQTFVRSKNAIPIAHETWSDYDAALSRLINQITRR